MNWGISYKLISQLFIILDYKKVYLIKTQIQPYHSTWLNMQMILFAQLTHLWI